MKTEDFKYIAATKQDVCINVAMFTYNQSGYIRQAIESILMQKTQYSYNIIIGEDCSTDDTRAILMEYYEKYPDKICLLLWNHNVGGEKNSVEVYKKCNADYVAYLEGDDYWTDPYKLEKQVSFLEQNKEYIGTAHNVKCVDKNGAFLHRDFRLYPYQEEHIYGFSDAAKCELPGQMASMVHRNFWREFDEKNWDKYLACDTNGDLKASVILGCRGQIYYFRDIMADHRREFVGESWTAQTAGKNLTWFLYRTKCELQRYMLEEFYIDLKIPIKDFVDIFYKRNTIELLYHPTKENFKIWWKFYWEKKRYEKR